MKYDSVDDGRERLDDLAQTEEAIGAMRLNGPCMLHGRFDCLDCCPELDPELGEDEWPDVPEFFGSQKEMEAAMDDDRLPKQHEGDEFCGGSYPFRSAIRRYNGL